MAGPSAGTWPHVHETCSAIAVIKFETFIFELV